MKRKKTNTDVDTNHADVGEVIMSFYLIGHNRKPDRAEYSQSYKIIKALMFPEEDYLRSYTKDEVIYALSQMKLQGIILKAPKMLYMDHLLSSFVDDDFVMQKYIVNKLRFMDESDGLIDSNLMVDVPEGW